MLFHPGTHGGHPQQQGGDECEEVDEYLNANGLLGHNIPTCRTGEQWREGSGLPPLWLPRRVEGLGRGCDLGVDGLKLDRGELSEAPLAPAAVVGPFDPGDDREEGFHRSVVAG